MTALCIGCTVPNFCFRKKGLSGEESMVLGHIQATVNQGDCEWFLASNAQLSSPHQGIWTKHLKAKTELHQTVIDRCLKSLVQKQLIKSVKGVKVFPLICLFSDVFPDLLPCSTQRAKFI
jgi:RNA polymerase Rpc34 subunit